MTNKKEHYYCKNCGREFVPDNPHSERNCKNEECITDRKNKAEAVRKAYEERRKLKRRKTNPSGEKRVTITGKLLYREEWVRKCMCGGWYYSDKEDKCYECKGVVKPDREVYNHIVLYKA